MNELKYYDDADQNKEFVDEVCMNHLHCTKLYEPTALVAQVSYDTGDDSTNWILDSGSTHHIMAFLMEFLT